MNPLVLFLLQTFAPVVAEALGAWIRSLEAAGTRPDDALAVATDIVRGIEHGTPDWTSAQRHDHAYQAIRYWMTEHNGGVEPPASTINATLELALQRVKGESHA